MAPAKKCVICNASNPTRNQLDNTITTNLSSILTNLCGQQLHITGQALDSICEECGMRMFLANNFVNKVRLVFGKKWPIENSQQAVKINSATLDVLPDVDYVDYVFNCEHCNFSSNKLKDFRQHMLVVHGIAAPKPYSCKQCPQAFARIDQYHKHKVKCHVEKPAEQTAIKKIKQCKVKKPAAQTTVEQETVEIKQELTDKPFFYVNENGEEIFKCPESNCKYESNRHKVFRRHMLKTHNETNAIFRCSICAKSYKLLYHYKLHMESCNNNGNGEANSTVSKLQNNAEKAQHTLMEQTTLKNAAATSTPLAKNSTELKAKRKSDVLENGHAQENSIVLEKSPKKQKKSETHLTNEVTCCENGLESPKKKKKKKKNKLNVDEVRQQEDQEERVIETFICEYCNKIFYSSHKLNRHLTKKHADQ